MTKSIYIYQSKLGEGSFGSVFKVKHKGTGAIRAIKMIKKARNGSAPWINDLILNNYTLSLDGKILYPKNNSKHSAINYAIANKYKYLGGYRDKFQKNENTIIIYYFKIFRKLLLKAILIIIIKNISRT